jgi:FAD/FMN-containing dehydrogenase
MGAITQWRMRAVPAMRRAARRGVRRPRTVAARFVSLRAFAAALARASSAPDSRFEALAEAAARAVGGRLVGHAAAEAPYAPLGRGGDGGPVPR